MKRSALALFVLVTVSALALSGCPKQNSATTPPKEHTLPNWYTAPPKGCASGGFDYKGNLDAAKTGATTRAHGNLAASLETTVQRLIKDATQEGAQSGESFSDELTTKVQRALVNRGLAGARTVKGDVDKERYYSLVCLEPAVFADALDEEAELKEKLRTDLKEQFEAEFEDLDRQLEKLGTDN